MQNANLRKIIDYYCFPTKTGDISVYTDLDQYTYWREMEYYQTTQEDVLLAKEKGKLLLFDLKNKKFVNEIGENIDISGKVIFPRSTIQDSDILLEYIEKAHGKSITLRQDYNIVEHWFNVVKTKRNFRITTRGEVEENIEKYEKIYGKKMFIKTVHKEFSGICYVIDLSDSTEESAAKQKYLIDFNRHHSINMSISNSNEPILVYEALDVLHDEYGKREWRAFVVNNELWCLSRFSDDVVPIEKYVYEKVNEKIKGFKDVMPSSYVVDFFEYEENDDIVFDVCEFNPIIASGVFQNNDLVF